MIIIQFFFIRWEGEKLELIQAVEAEKLASREALKPLEELQLQHTKLVEVIRIVPIYSINLLCF
jgi:hypothetical protein